MFVIIHALLGGLIGKSFDSLLFIILISLVLHFFLDIIPHWDSHYNKELFHVYGKIKTTKITALIQIFDLLLGFALIFYLYYKFDSKLVLLGAFASIFPDLVKLGYYLGFRKSSSYMRYLKFHSRIQKDVSWKLGLLTQFIILVLLLKILF